MENHEIQTVLMNALSLQEAHVTGDGSHFQVIAVGEMFDGTFTPQEWARDRKLNGF
ncbi:MAG: hypothetical protein E6314_07920 [Enterobacter sp.]|nr:hypothetical protein [Enterobacter sp.]